MISIAWIRQVEVFVSKISFAYCSINYWDIKIQSFVDVMVTEDHIGAKHNVNMQNKAEYQMMITIHILYFDKNLICIFELRKMLRATVMA